MLLSQPGTWWSGGERRAIAEEARRARFCDLCDRRRSSLGVELTVEGHDCATTLPAPVCDAIHRMASDPARLTERWYRSVVPTSLSDERYVELVAVVAFVTAIDVFDRGVGASERPLPDPQEGEPTRQAPPEASRCTTSWVRVVDPRDATGDVADLYARFDYVPNLWRALTLVPAEARALLHFSDVQYLPAERLLDIHYERTLSRCQTELVATRTAAINDCYYCATVHASLLEASGATWSDAAATLSQRSAIPSTAVAGADELAEFVDALLTQPSGLDRAREALKARLGEEGMVEAAAVTAVFTAVNRVADATGTELDDVLAEASADRVANSISRRGPLVAAVARPDGRGAR